jgi:hypothetical protein
MVCIISDESGQHLVKNKNVYKGRDRIRITYVFFSSGVGAPYYQQGAVYPPADPYSQVKSSSPLLFLNETCQTRFLNIANLPSSLVRMAYYTYCSWRILISALLAKIAFIRF